MQQSNQTPNYVNNFYNTLGLPNVGSKALDILDGADPSPNKNLTPITKFFYFFYDAEK